MSQMRKFFRSLGVMLLGLVLLAPAAMAQVFPVDASSTTTITNIKTDVVAWGIVLISVLLVLYAFRKVAGLIRRG